MSSTTRENRVISRVPCPKCEAPRGRACSVTHDNRPIVCAERRVAWQAHIAAGKVVPVTERAIGRQHAQALLRYIESVHIASPWPPDYTLDVDYLRGAADALRHVLGEDNYLEHRLARLMAATRALHAKARPGCDCDVCHPQVQKDIISFRKMGGDNS